MEPDPDECSFPGMEVLEWEPNHKESVKGLKPAPSYNKLTENARKIICGDNQCVMFCRGKKCKFCTWNFWKPNNMAIDGLYSHWITDKILAMSRPTTRALGEKKVLDQFIGAKIKTVINLQMPGEHASCGHGNEPSGFSYNPQVLMDHNIFFYNFGWDDFGVGSMSTILDIVKVMQFAVTEGKVAIHCHAGLGRTGVLIACYLVFNNRMTDSNAIHYVRHRRRGSIQSSVQVRCVHDFEIYLKPFRVIFAKLADEHEVSLRQFLNRQKHLLHGFEARKLKYIPKIVYICCERLLELAHRGNSLGTIRKSSSMLNLSADPVTDSFSRSATQPTQSPRLTADSQPAGLPSHSKSFNSFSNKQFRDTLTINNGEDSTQTNDDPDNDDDCIVYGYSKDKPKLETGSDSCCSSNSSTSEMIRNSRGDDSSSDSTSSTSRGRLSKKSMLKFDTVAKTSRIPSSATASQHKMQVRFAEQVAEALSANEYSEEIQKKVTKLESDLNNSDEVWGELASETSAQVLSAVLWDWLDQLKEPVLNAQDLNTMLSSADKPHCALQKVEKNIKHMIEYVALVIVHLKPLPEWTEWRLLERLLSHLTHQVVKKDMLSYEATRHREHWVEMKSRTAERLFTLFLRLMDSLSSQNIKHMIEYVALVIVHLKPLPEWTEWRLLERLLSHLTHQVVKKDMLSYEATRHREHWVEMKSRTAERLFTLFLRLMDSLSSQVK